MEATSAPTRLRTILSEEGRKQRWLADQIGADESQVSRWLHGLHVPEHRRLQIAEALRRTPEDVFPEGPR